MDYNLPELIIIKREIMPYVKITGKITVSILYLSEYATPCFKMIIIRYFLGSNISLNKDFTMNINTKNFQ